jgi:hypothetical protein
MRGRSSRGKRAASSRLSRGRAASTIPSDITRKIEERIKSLPQKAPAKSLKPVARRRPAVQPIRKKPVAKKPVTRNRIPEINIPAGVPEIVRKRIQELMASSQTKAPTTPRKAAVQPVRKKPTAKKTAPKKKAAPKKTADSSSFVFKPKKLYDSSFEGTPGSGRVSSGTTVFDRYDPETDTYYGTIGGVAGSMPTSVKGSEVSKAFKKNWAAANKGYTPPKQQTSSQTPAPQTPAPQAPTPPTNPLAASFATPQSINQMIPRNIVGQTFDPNVAMPPMPPQPFGSVFGGYGQQAPMQAMAPFAGMAQNNPPPIEFFPGSQSET